MLTFDDVINHSRHIVRKYHAQCYLIGHQTLPCLATAYISISNELVLLYCRNSSVVEPLPLIREAWIQFSAIPTKALAQDLNLCLLLGPYPNGASAC